MPNKTTILGAGIAGISAGYHLKQKGQNSVIFEKDSDWGGLCGNFTINGFRFDRFVHFTFVKDPYILGIFENSSPLYAHPAISYNYYQKSWLKHPALTNLAPLPTEEKIKIINSFATRPQKSADKINNYAEWLEAQNGSYFASRFAGVYTRKYWGQQPENMETKWIGNRIYSPTLEEVLRGSYNEQKQNFYYTSYMKYPKSGGFRSILNTCREGLDIRFNKKVTRIVPKNKTLYFADGSSENYERLISTLPLPEIVNMIDNCPQDVKVAANKLHWTCGYQVSLGFNKPDIAKYLWFYIYDEDILPARVYSPSLKSPDNTPAGCSSLQAEIFFDCKKEIPPAEKVLSETVTKLKEVCNFSEQDIIVKDIRFEPYANVTFTHEIYQNREIIKNYLLSQNIEPIGRFGLWDYLWSFQAFKSAMNL